MEQQPWAAIGSLAISVLALIIAGMSLRISWRKDRREIEAMQTTGFATIEPVADQQNWYEVTIKIENRSDHGWRLTAIDIHWPLRVRGMRAREALAISPSGEYETISPLPMEKTLRKLHFDEVIRKAGTQPARSSYGLQIGTGDSHVETIFVFVPRRSFWSRVLSMRVSLSSMLPVERPTFIDIKRTFPH